MAGFIKIFIGKLTHAVEMVIKAKFLSSRDISGSKEADSNFSVHRPLLSFAIRVAAVIHEAREIPFGESVDDVVTVDGEEVVIADIVFVVFFDALLASRFIDKLSHIFQHKFTTLDFWMKKIDIAILFLVLLKKIILNVRRRKLQSR